MRDKVGHVRKHMKSTPLKENVTDNLMTLLTTIKLNFPMVVG